MKPAMRPSAVGCRANVRDGIQKINWAWRNMPVLRGLAYAYGATQPFRGLRIAMSIHVEAKTACLARALAEGGAEIALTGCNPLSTQDDVAAGLAADGISVYCVHGVSQAEYETHLEAALSCRPNLVLDDGGDLARRLHSDMRDLAQDVYGATEETTTGVRRLRALARDGGLLYPVVAVNDARSKNLFDNRFGTGQSVVTAVMNTSNRMFGGSTVVVAGYGMCGKGVALRSRGLGADVVVCEVDPIKAAEAIMDGYRVMTMDDAAHVGDIFITVTGCRDVIRTRHYAAMKDNVLLANAGHFDVEINVGELAAAATESWQVRPGMVGYKMRDGRVLCLLAEGRLVNLAAGDGHPIEIMDMSFSLQAECLRYIAESRGSLPVGVLRVPDSIDRYVAERLLDARTARIDRLTAEQAGYLDSFGMGE